MMDNEEMKDENQKNTVEQKKNSISKTIKEKISIRIPQTKQTIRSNIILAIGMVLLIIGLVCCAKNYYVDKDIKVIGSVILLAAGEICFFVCFGFLKLSSLVYLGSFFVLNGIFVFFAESEYFTLGFAELWPIAIINTGLSFIPYQLHKFKKFKTLYLFPGITFICLGIIFLLFSLKVFPVTFVQFIKVWWPLIFIVFGFGLIVTFFIQKRGKAKARLENYVDFEESEEGDSL